MVAIRSSHFTKNSEFNPKKWISNIRINSQQSCQCLYETWDYCLQTTYNIINKELILWRCIEIAEIISILRMDIDTLQTALLFPLVDAGIITEDLLYKRFSKTIVLLISKLKNITTNQININTSYSLFSENKCKSYNILPFIVDDLRCIILKLAERIIYLREVKYAPKNKRVIVARECANIYVPLANRLGIWQIKWELEDYCFRYLHPDGYKLIANLLNERRIDRENYIERFVNNLKNSMREKSIRVEVYGRPKHIYSIWRKMQKKHVTFNEVFDIRAVRIIAENLQYCYAVLKIVHTSFRHLPNEFDNYITNPKPNGYQSIHTVVFGPDEKIVEIQIRTKQMHRHAELGIAAHWKYKENVLDNTYSIYRKYMLSNYLN